MINLIAGTSMNPSPKVCLLGLVEDVASGLADRTLIGLLLFYARKAITPHWKKQASPLHGNVLLIALFLIIEIHTFTEVAPRSMKKFGPNGLQNHPWPWATNNFYWQPHLHSLLSWNINHVLVLGF